MSKKRVNNNGGIVYSTSSDFNFSEEKKEVENLPAEQQLLKIKLDTKHRSGKVVTLIEGFSMSEEEIQNIAKQIKSFCGAGGSSKNSEIIIQGDHRDKILQWLLRAGFTKSKKINCN